MARDAKKIIIENRESEIKLMICAKVVSPGREIIVSIDRISPLFCPQFTIRVLVILYMRKRI